jgi:hypothetical protein
MDEMGVGRLPIELSQPRKLPIAGGLDKIILDWPQCFSAFAPPVASV